ncbi:MAG: four helix bundle protein [Armatimonadetes bacterium CG_4_10_14_3_um_filter_66_18]|nr:MAG: four helix bundle protein [Armatimonadetes bacterium CG06_land_8_20_14_3_00_66_21]PIX37511.1 MAG: four helix bundle protein [Armatimonadetes bacterium CG_4_8_14_3_um_filter_66_20]PIY50447.1 MAG: four helix bundle protein [Armatimonadetes bacterium CG_4_10_14_3_um_filter_66_18]PIZ43966.1 MAG: four helix bundle protein [Armatimonadetes bacterium CG_4_10_14_0_8_um_filter_66_14]PJB62367.1 MAG: four helix bundle protein [Armatimonadetes bacterium CG_4_9_14_3_um_filter_66_14]
MTPDKLSERMLEFASNIVGFTDALPKTRAGRHIAGQLLRCGTSPGPNYEEACAAESRADFIHKLRIVLKELRESRFWIRLVAKRCLLPADTTGPLCAEASELCNIIGKSVVTANERRKNRMR